MIFYFNQISFEAYITVTWLAGGVCTISNGNVSYTAPNTSGSYTFTVEEEGTYTATVTVGSYTFTGSVSITENGQSKTLAVDCTLYIVKNGTINTSVAGTINASKQIHSGNYLILGGEGHNWFTLENAFSKQISTKGYKKLSIKWCMSNINEAEYNTKYVKLSVGSAASVSTESRSSLVTSAIDLTSVQGTYTFSFEYQGGSAWDAYFTIQNLLLT